MTNLIHQFDFSIGKKVSNKEIKAWHQKVLEAIKENENLDFTSTASGNSIVIGIRRRGEEPGIDIIEITKGYKIYNYDL